MFRWKDYEENTCLFIDGIDTNVAVLRYKDFQLTDTTTGNKFKMKSSCIEEAKVDAENFLKDYWSRVQKDINKIMAILLPFGSNCTSVRASASRPGCGRAGRR